MWEELHQSLDIKPAVGRPQPKPTDAVLDSFEVKHAFSFPESYREFVKLFGPGELRGYFRIFAPGCGNSNSGDIADFQKQLKKCTSVFAKVYKDEEFVRRMIPFGDTIGGDVFVWDSRDVYEDSGREYRIYTLPNDSDQILKVADTFTQFVKRVCLGTGFVSVAGKTIRKLAKTFVPFGKQRRFRSSS